MSANQVDAPDRPSPAPSLRGGITDFADRWPFRRKLNTLVGIPLVVVAALLSYVIVHQVDDARSAASAAQLVRDSREVAELVSRVEAEHQQAVLLSVRYESAAPGYPPSPDAYEKAQVAVESAVVDVRRAFGSRLPADEAQALKEVSGLTSLRDSIEKSYMPADNIDPAYANAADELIDGLGLDRNESLASTFTGNLLDSLLRTDAAHGSFETSVFSAQTGDANALIELVSAIGSHELYEHQAARFGRYATEEQISELGGIEHNASHAILDLRFAALQVDPSSLVSRTPTQLTTSFTTALTDYQDYQKLAAVRLKITSSLIDEIAARADRASTDAWWRAAWLLGAALVGFMLWLAFTVAVRRSVVRPVQALTGAAQQVAEVAGLELARVADDDAADVGPPRLREVPVTVRDEIGELAEAFNRVQNTAAALLERQVLSRRNVAEMFGNVGRRVSNLTTRQLALIDAVERGETDPALLDRLYRIDHIAVRLQRNADSLMLLAGIRETGLEASPTPLTNVARAALGQIEGYQRVRLHAETEVTVAPDIIGDLTLMLAELLENAVAFSPAGSPVEVSVRAGGDGARIEIADHGLGMSAERLAEENARLIRRERLDLVPTKVLGLFVVGILARRWGVEVVLDRTPGGGVTSRVVIPSSLLLLMSPVVPVPAGRSASYDTARTPAAPAEPSPAAALPRRSEAAEPTAPGALPRRIPRQETPPADDGDATARPLRRRVRGATLRTTDAGAGRPAARQAARPADAEEVRSALDEFEAAVERAHRDSAAPTTSDNDHHDLTGLPEGAEQ